MISIDTIHHKIRVSGGSSYFLKIDLDVRPLIQEILERLLHSYFLEIIQLLLETLAK